MGESELPKPTSRTPPSRGTGIIGPTGTLATNRPEFEWYAVSGADGYPLDIAKAAAKAKKELGWVPEITVEEMCAEMVESDLDVARRHALLKARKKLRIVTAWDAKMQRPR